MPANANPEYEFGRSDAASVRKGRVIVTALIAGNVGLMLYLLLIQSLIVPLSDMVNPAAGVCVIFMLFLGLMVGMFWARAILIVLYLLSAIVAFASIVNSLGSFNPTLLFTSLLWGVGAAATAYILLLSSDLCLFMEARRQGWTPESVEPAEPIFFAEDEAVEGDADRLEECPWCGDDVVRPGDEICPSCGRPV